RQALVGRVELLGKLRHVGEDLPDRDRARTDPRLRLAVLRLRLRRGAVALRLRHEALVRLLGLRLRPLVVAGPAARWSCSSRGLRALARLIRPGLASLELRAGGGGARGD